MMRKLFVFTMVAGLVAMGGFVRDARAGATIDLLFVGHNGNPIAPTNCAISGGTDPGCHPVNTGDALTMAAIMRNDQTLTIAIFSLNYDLGGDNELDVVSVFQWGGLPINKQATDFFAPPGPLSPTTATFAGSFQGATTNFTPRLLPVAGGAFAGGYQMGTVVWKVNAGVENDGADIMSGLVNFGVDFFADADFLTIANQLLFRGATVNIVPEPGTASLLGLGLVGLILVGRRSRS
jgi:hypothetical protein